MATHSTTPGVAGTGVGLDRMVVPAASKRDNSRCQLDAVGSPYRVAEDSCPHSVVRTTATTPTPMAAGTAHRRRRATDVATCPATTVATMGPTTAAAPGALVSRAAPRPAASDTARSQTSGASRIGPMRARGRVAVALAVAFTAPPPWWRVGAAPREGRPARRPPPW